MKLSEVELEKITELTIEQKNKIVYGGYTESTLNADVALLLGANINYMEERARKAGKLYLDGRVKYVMPTGGVEWEYNGEMITEAHYMAGILREMGVPEDAILIENEARTTRENMKCAAILLNDLFGESLKRIFIVTSPSHIKRSVINGKRYLPENAEIIGIAADSEVDAPDKWYKSEAVAPRVEAEVRRLKVFVDRNLMEDMEI